MAILAFSCPPEIHFYGSYTSSNNHHTILTLCLELLGALQFAHPTSSIKQIRILVFPQLFHLFNFEFYMIIALIVLRIIN